MPKPRAAAWHQRSESEPDSSLELELESLELELERSELSDHFRMRLDAWVVELLLLEGFLAICWGVCSSDGKRPHRGQTFF